MLRKYTAWVIGLWASSQVGCSLISRFEGPARGACIAGRVFYVDRDGDGYGDTSQAVMCLPETIEAGVVLVERAGDCNDNDPNVNPTAIELCDGWDDNCNAGGGTDPSEDRDGDRHAPVTHECRASDTVSPDQLRADRNYIPKDDCDDAAPERNPANREICDAIDNNCDGQVDEVTTTPFCGGNEPQGQWSCNSSRGRCVYVCDPLRADCDRSPENGCETDLATDRNNCGGCGLHCGIGGLCRNGMCEGRITDIAAGEEHTCAIKQTSVGDTVVCWGSNESGQVGPNAPDDGRVPSSALIQPCQDNQRPCIRDIASGFEHSCAVVNGRVQCWGDNTRGQLGRVSASVNTNLPPAETSAITGTVEQIVASGATTCARTQDNQLYCWGDNSEGQLGTGTVGGMMTAPSLVQLGQNALQVRDVSVSAALFDMNGTGEYTEQGATTCAVGVDDRVYCWGNNPGGTLGNSSGAGMPRSAVPLPITFSLGSEWQPRNVVVGSRHACALFWAPPASGTTDDRQTIYCWGADDEGQVGDDDTSSMMLEPWIPRGIALGSEQLGGTNWLTAQGLSTCGVFNNQVLCWGDNENGQLGDGGTGDSDSPGIAVGLDDVSRVVMGWGHSCALRLSGGVACWGFNNNGQLGDGSNARRREPVPVRLITASVSVVGAGVNACALRATGDVYCWGQDSKVWQPLQSEAVTSGVLSPRPVDLQMQCGNENGIRARTLGVGNSFACVSSANGNVVCWGENSASGQLGGTPTGGNNDNRVCLQFPNAEPIQQVAVGIDFACARSGQNVWCWGNNDESQAGVEDEDVVPTPRRFNALGRVAEISLGDRHGCARTINGRVRCWGANDAAQLGNGERSDTPTAMPAEVRNIDDAIQVVSGAAHSCALSTRTGQEGASRVVCWGDNRFGQLGRNDVVQHNEPDVVPGLTNAVRLASGRFFTCALTSTGTVQCWGRNGFGQLGDGSTTDRPRPGQVLSVGAGVELFAGHDHMCAKLTDDQLVCWGRNEWGQLGDGTDDDRFVPVPVRSLP